MVAGREGMRWERPSSWGFSTPVLTRITKGLATQKLLGLWHSGQHHVTLLRMCPWSPSITLDKMASLGLAGSPLTVSLVGNGAGDVAPFLWRKQSVFKTSAALCGAALPLNAPSSAVNILPPLFSALDAAALLRPSCVPGKFWKRWDLPLSPIPDSFWILSQAGKPELIKHLIHVH